MKDHWETTHGERTCYVELHQDALLVGEHHGTAASDGAGTCTLREFLQGRYQASIRADHGPAALAEIVAAVEARLMTGPTTT